MLNIAVVIPTYNEATNIERMVDTLYRDVFPTIPNIRPHLVVVDDNSPDGTGRIVKGLSDSYPRLYLLSGVKKGLGHAYVRGFMFAINDLRTDALLEMDADFQHDPKKLKEMVEVFMNGADVVIGSRFIPGGSIPLEWAWYRKIISTLGNRIARTMLRMRQIHDLTSGFRLTRVKGVMEHINLKGLMALERFAYKVDLLHQTVGLAEKVVEVPIRFAPRKKESSKFNLIELFATYHVLIRLMWRDKKRGRK